RDRGRGLLAVVVLPAGMGPADDGVRGPALVAAGAVPRCDRAAAGPGSSALPSPGSGLGPAPGSARSRDRLRGPARTGRSRPPPGDPDDARLGHRPVPVRDRVRLARVVAR